LILIGLALLTGCHHHHPEAAHHKGKVKEYTPTAPQPDDAAASPAPDQPNPITHLSSTPAPLLNFDNDVYFVISSTEKGARKSLEFVRDGDKPETALRSISVRFEPTTSLRGYEKAFLRSHPGVAREVHYRSKQRLAQSVLLLGPEGATDVVMEWRYHKGGLVCCEFTAHQSRPVVSATPTPHPKIGATPKVQPPPPPDPSRRAFEALVNAKELRWQKDLVQVYKESPQLLSQAPEAAVKTAPGHHPTPKAKLPPHKP
jgi:hypothetical protein